MIYLLSLFLIVFTGLLDQWTKHLVFAHWLQGDFPQKITSFFNLTFAKNTGAAFSFLNEAGDWHTTFFLCVNGLLSLGIFIALIYYNRAKKYITSAALSLMLGGALGNIMDRIHLGYVIDFLDVHWNIHHWPVFNVADSAICIGAFLFVLSSRGDKK